jgi:transcription initiation factor TFIID subunit 7
MKKFAMEQQFILRLPDTLKNIDLKDAKIKLASQREVTMTYKDQSYPGIICRLPTILETQKNIDNKLYKIADISTIVVIYKDKNFDLNTEITKIENSGITAPTAFIKERKFRPTTVRSEMVEEIEKKVAELLKEDLRATKVEIVDDENDSSNDLSMFAAEIENELPEKMIPSNMEEILLKDDRANMKAAKTKEPAEGKTKETAKKEAIMARKEERKNTNQKETAVAKSIKPQYSKTPSNNLQANKNAAEKGDKAMEIKNINVKSQDLFNVGETKESLEERDIIDQIEAEMQHQEKSGPEENLSPELKQLQCKIHEKEELLKQTFNPILKKRFENAIAELKAEFEKKKQQSK